MPFNINNVDITVAANAVYGITMMALTDLVDDPTTLIDADVEVYWYFLSFVHKYHVDPF